MKGFRMTDYATSSTFGAGVTNEASTTEQVKDQVRDKAQVAQDKARDALGQTRGQLRDQVDQRSTEAGERLTGTAADARSIAEELRRQGKDAPARMVDQVAGQAERLGDYLKGASGDHILRDVEDFARSKPWLVAAGGLVLGFAGSRFLKASSGRRYRSYDTDRFATSTNQAAHTGPTTSGSVDSTVDPAYRGSPHATERVSPEPAYPATTTNDLFDGPGGVEPGASDGPRRDPEPRTWPSAPDASRGR
jgi:ElaB/YqjD/DUF883 family membrane-anchored ribosome-binding protein